MASSARSTRYDDRHRPADREGLCARVGLEAGQGSPRLRDAGRGAQRLDPTSGARRPRQRSRSSPSSTEYRCPRPIRPTGKRRTTSSAGCWPVFIASGSRNTAISPTGSSILSPTTSSTWTAVREEADEFEQLGGDQKLQAKNRRVRRAAPAPVRRQRGRCPLPQRLPRRQCARGSGHLARHRLHRCRERDRRRPADRHRQDDPYSTRDNAEKLAGLIAGYGELPSDWTDRSCSTASTTRSNYGTGSSRSARPLISTASPPGLAELVNR